MQRFVVEAEYTVPHYVRFAVEAETEGQALIIGAQVADDVNGDHVWIDPSKDYESSSRTTVTIISDHEEDPEDLPLYQAPERPCDIGGASSAPAIRHLAHDLFREMKTFLEASEREGADDIDLCALINDWRNRLEASL